MKMICLFVYLFIYYSVVCSHKEVVRSVGVCVNGTQRFLIIKSVLDGCRCKAVQSIEYRPCCKSLWLNVSSLIIFSSFYHLGNFIQQDNSR